MSIAQRNLDLTDPSNKFPVVDLTAKVSGLPPLRPSQPLVCFTFDDCFEEDTTVVLPILTSAGVKGGFLIPSGYPQVAAGHNGLMSWGQVQALYAAGHEIIAHSVDHSHLGTFGSLTNSQTLAQINNVAAYAAKGISVRGFGYPFGEHDAAQRKLVRDYYDYGLGLAGDSGSQAPLSTYCIRRITLSDATVTATHTAQIDTAIANNEILIFITHSGSGTFTSGGGGTTRLANVIAYAQSHGVPVVTPSQAFDLVRNVFDAGDYAGGSTYSVINSAGRLYATSTSTGAFGFPYTVDPGFVRSSDARAAPQSNGAVYLRVLGGGTISKIGLHVQASSGNISVGVHQNSGVGRAAVPGARIATSGAVACPAVGYAEVSLGGSVTVAVGDWISLSADNVTASFLCNLGVAADSNIGLGRQFRQPATAHPVPATPSSLIATVGYSIVLVGAP